MTDLPEGWREVALGALTKIKYGKSLDKSLRDDSGQFPVVGSAGVMTMTNEPLISEPCVIVGRKGNVGAVQYFPNGCHPIDTVYYFVAPESIEANFLNLSLESKKLKDLDSSTAIPSLRREDLEGVLLLVPPLAEQERIVEILEEQFSRLDSALASVKAVREKAKAFRRSLLHSAFSGELTGGTEGWREVALGELLEVLIDHRGKTPKKLGGDFTDSGVRVISAIHIKQGKVKFDERDRFVTEEMFLRWMPEKVLKGDVLLTSEAPLGSVAEVISDEPLVLSQRLFCLRADGKQLTNRFLALFLTSPEGQLGLRGRSSGTTVTGIRQSELVCMVTPVPPLSTQERIVSLLEEQFSRLDKALEVANQLEARIASEHRSLLHSAFTGALTATWRQNND